MDILKQQLEQKMEYINDLINKGDITTAISEYSSFEKEIEDENNNSDEAIKADFYSAFAFALFAVSEYEKFIIRLQRAQSYGYPAEQIRKILWEGFIEPNLNELRSNYEKNIKFLLSDGYILETIDFDDLPFWLITTGVNNEYYIYDKKEEIIKEKFTLYTDYEKYSPLKIEKSVSGCLILEKWNFNVINSCLKDRNIRGYCVVDDLGKFLSCFQGELLKKERLPDLVVFNGLDSMKKYFAGTSEYLPKSIVDFTSKGKAALEVIEEIHQERISRNGRRGDNILLSICIPSYSRGKRAYDSVLHHLQLQYDEEIEIVVSNNGTQNESREYYEKISSIEDSRLIYHAYEENQGFTHNLCKVCELAHGKFVLLLSDEDLADINELHKVMSILDIGTDTLAVVRTQGDRQAGVPSTNLARPGREALTTYMLTSNYVSGVIFNNNLLKQYGTIKYVKDNLNNSVCLYYPHMVWELMLCQYGYALGLNITLIREGEAEKTTAWDKRDVGLKNKVIIPHYASIEGRIEQHEGFFRVFKDLEVCQRDFLLFREMYLRLCNKTFYLTNLSINAFYKKADTPLRGLFHRVYETCSRLLDELYAKQLKLKKYNYKQYYSEDLEIIKKTYIHYLDSLE